MKCPSCDSLEDKVIDSRTGKDGLSIRRRRECISCGRRYTTYEYIENVQQLVVKSDGGREEYNRSKLLAGIHLSTKNLPIASDKIDNIVKVVEEKLHSLPEREVTARFIGEIVMAELKKLDHVAYVRFASVYYRFQNKEEFLKEVEKL